MIKALSPSRFEQVILDLMLRLGYGGLTEDAAVALGQVTEGSMG
jgi:restriction endonuclease Mrr